MSRPDFLNCVMTSNIIRRIVENQENYDADPERYEREEKRKEEDRQRELEQEYESREKELK